MWKVSPKTPHTQFLCRVQFYKLALKTNPGGSKASAVTFKSAFRISAGIPSIPAAMLFFSSRWWVRLDHSSVTMRGANFVNHIAFDCDNCPLNVTL
jgi:hypothetical protein